MSDAAARVIDALNAHDVDAFIACYAEDAVIQDGDGAVLARGHDGFRARYAPMLTKFPDAHWEVLARIETGDYVVQHEEVTGRGDTTRHVCVYRVQDGRIAHERVLR